MTSLLSLGGLIKCITLFGSASTTDETASMTIEPTMPSIDSEDQQTTDTTSDLPTTNEGKMHISERHFANVRIL